MGRAPQWTSASGCEYAGSALGGVTGYTSAADVEVNFTGDKPCKAEKKPKSDADLRGAAAKLIRSVWCFMPARCDVDITLEKS